MNYSTLSIWQAIEKEIEFSDRLPSKFFPRLAEAVESINGDIDVSLKAGLDENMHKSVQGHIRASVDVECQRCLEPFEEILDLEFRWIPVQSDYEADKIGDEEAVIVLEEEDPIELLYHLEDELLLALPIIPYHSDNEPCEGREFLKNQEMPEEEEKKNPFAVLSDLLD